MTSMRSWSPCVRFESTSTVAIVPGPAIIGMANGKTAPLPPDGPSRSSSSDCFAPVRRANNMSTAIKNNRMPPAIVNAGSVIPR
jgi:hypothetical protein